MPYSPVPPPGDEPSPELPPAGRARPDQPRRGPSSEPGTTPPARPTPLPAGTAVLVGLLLVIPLIGLAVVPLYSRTSPALFGFPFFYWYQLMWVLITPVLTYAAFVIIQRARGRR